MLTLQSRALLCLGNLVSGFEVADLGGEPGLHQIWSGLSKLAISHSGIRNLIYIYLHHTSHDLHSLRAAMSESKLVLYH